MTIKLTINTNISSNNIVVNDIIVNYCLTINISC